MGNKNITLAAIAATTLVGSALAVWTPTAQAATYSPSYSAPITINDNGPATPTPAIIELYGAGPAITDVDVSLNGVTHSFPSDLDILLRGPDGTTVALMSDACGNPDLAGASLTFDDAAAAPMEFAPASACSGSYKPTDIAAGPADVWDFPPNATSLAAFNGTNPNGFWYLFVRDDDAGSAGTINGGWTLNITTAGSAAITVPGSTAGAGGGPASAYPFELPVSGTSGPVSDVNVTIPGLHHYSGEQLDMVLVSPSGAAVMLMSDACGTDAGLAGVTLTFDDQAATPLGNSPASCPTGRYRPTNAAAEDFLPAPAPAEPYSGALSAFNGTGANGTWRLFVNDDTVFDGGFITAPPFLQITTADVVAPDTSVTKKPKSSTKTRAKIKFTSNEPGVHFECKVDKVAFKPCTSPLKLKNLKVGKHKVQVRAVDAAGNVDPTPAKVKWRVKQG